MPPGLASPGSFDIKIDSSPTEILTGTMTVNDDGDLMVWSQNSMEWLAYPPIPAKHPMDIACEYSDLWGEIDEKYGDLQSLRDQYIKAVNENEDLIRIRAEYDRLHEKYFIFEVLCKPYET